MKRITFPVLILLGLCWSVTIPLVFGFLIKHDKDPMLVLFSVFTFYGLNYLVLKFLYKATIPSLINLDRRRNKQQLNIIKKYFKMPNITTEQMKNVSGVLADPNFNIEDYAKNVRGFMKLIEDAQETDLRMKARHIEATVGMLLGGGRISPRK